MAAFLNSTAALTEVYTTPKASTNVNAPKREVVAIDRADMLPTDKCCRICGDWYPVDMGDKDNPNWCKFCGSLAVGRRRYFKKRNKKPPCSVPPKLRFWDGYFDDE